MWYIITHANIFSVYVIQQKLNFPKKIPLYIRIPPPSRAQSSLKYLNALIVLRQHYAATLYYTHRAFLISRARATFLFFLSSPNSHVESDDGSAPGGLVIASLRLSLYIYTPLFYIYIHTRIHVIHDASDYARESDYSPRLLLLLLLFLLRLIFAFVFFFSYIYIYRRVLL